MRVNANATILNKGTAIENPEIKKEVQFVSRQMNFFFCPANLRMVRQRCYRENRRIKGDVFQNSPHVTIKDFRNMGLSPSV